MPIPAISRPAPGEYDPYYGRYIALVPEGDILAILQQQIAPTLAFLRGMTETQSLTRYEAGKWSIKEVLGHLCDAERIMSYRALRIGRGDQTPIPGFEQDDYINGANFDARPWHDLLSEFDMIRAATLALFRGFETAATERLGTANDAAVSVRALAFIIAGHERHHMNILRERYLPGLK